MFMLSYLLSLLITCALLTSVRGSVQREIEINVDASTMTPVEETAAGYVNLLQAFGKAFNLHDAATLVSLMTDDCTFYMSLGPSGSPAGTSVRGKAEVQKAFETTFVNFPDATWASRGPDYVSQTADGVWRGVSMWTFRGTRLSDGASYDTNGVDVFEFRDGKIFIKDAYRKDVPPIVPVKE